MNGKTPLRISDVLLAGCSLDVQLNDELGTRHNVQSDELDDTRHGMVLMRQIEHCVLLCIDTT